MPLGANAVVLVTYRSDFAQQRYLLTLTYRISATNSTQTPALDTIDIVTFFTNTAAGTLQANYRNCLADNVTINRVNAQGIWPIRFIRQQAVVANAGTWGATAVTGNVAGVLTLRTALSGRKQVSNKHIGPIASNAMAAGAPVAGLTTALGNLVISMVTSRVVDCTTAGQTMTLDPCIFHRSTGTSDLIESGNSSDRIGTMRSRTLRVGE